MRRGILTGVAALAITSFAGAAFAADSPPVTTNYQPLPAPTATPAPFDWTGFYGGLSAGYGWGDADYNNHPVDMESPFNSAFVHDGNRMHGMVGGIFAGWNFAQWNHLVLGVEGNLLFNNIDGDHDHWVGDDVYNLATEMGMIYGVRARAGFALDRVMPYVSAGWAGSSVEAFQSLDGVTWSNKQTVSGLTLGAGIDYAITDRFVVGVDYNYYDFGEVTFTALDSDGGRASMDGDVDLHTFMVRGAFKF